MDSKGSVKKSEETAFKSVDNEENDDCEKEKNENDCSPSMYGDIKSTAVVKFSAVEPPTRYMQLSSNTNLNQPPSNWLRGTAKLQGKWGEWTYRSSHDKIFTSFHLANNFTDCVGKVDVISDAENIKKLLKIPYGKSHISMMVHRVGKTLLLDEFDIHKHLLRASQKQFEWLRKFYFEHVLQPQEVEHPMLRKRKSRGYLQNRNMFSKFLYYSLDDSNDDSKETSNVCDDQRDHSKVGCDSSLRDPSENPVQPLVPDILKETEEHIESGSHEFLRNVLWTFEDIRMLIGSDLLIFGDEEYPAVSLKLRDMEKPISVLTGLDYWLDNLMCNVPEVVMCFHVNGIVQKYELIKTEDIPQMKNSQFSPQVVKDIAQNILSFLKSNATKSGHTYWLFKGKNDDVVKLYDLTTLCADVMDDKDQNPFKLPVAMLLYRVACNIKESQDGPRKQGTIYQLLTNCLRLLSKNESPQITTSVHYLLSEVYVPSGVNPMSVHGNCPSDESDSEDEKNDYDEDGKNDYNDHEDEADNLSSFPTDIDFGSPSVSVNSLCRPKKCTEVFSGLDKPIPPLSKNWEERCIAALGHIVEGLKCVVNVEDSEEEEQSKSSGSANCSTNDSPLHFKAREEKVKVAKPFQPIPLNYSPINSPNSKEQDLDMESANGDMTDSQSSPFESESVPSWKLCCKILLLQKASQTYCALAEIANSNKRYGAALKFIKLGLLCYEHTPKFVASHCSKWLTEPLAYLLSLAGDALFMIYHRDFGNNNTSHRRDYESSGELDLDIINIMKKNFGELHINTLDYSWAWSWPSDFESSLSHSSHAYEVALKVWPEKLSDGKESLKKRYGNILNELGVWYMNQAIEMLKDDTSKDSKGKINEKFLHLLNKSFKSLESGIVYFESVNDIANQALLNSNIGRLMRITAHAWAPYTVEGMRKEFSSQERHYFTKAVNYYNKAAYTLGDTKDLPEIRDTVTWELSCTLFNWACLLQDYAPLSSYAQEQVEREVSELMMKALKLGEADHPPQKFPLYQYRAAKIHHKLGSLYHNAFRNQANEDHRRRQMRTLADMHYSKSCAIFSTLEHCNEFLITLMERIGLWEHHLTGLSGFGSRLKAFYTIINCMISAKPVLSSSIKASYTNKLNKSAEQEPVNFQDNNDMSQFLISEDDDEKERQKLLDIFHQRLQLAIIGLVKLFSTKSNRNQKELKQWREVSMFVSKYSIEDNLVQHVCSVLEQLEAIVLQRSFNALQPTATRSTDLPPSILSSPPASSEECIQSSLQQSLVLQLSGNYIVLTSA